MACEQARGEGIDTLKRHMSKVLPLGVLALFFGLDALVFRTGFYVKILEPISSAGLTMNYIWHEQARVHSSAPQVLALGHSRMAFDTTIANSLHTSYEFGSIAVPGTLPRSWYYMLREVDPGAGKYAAVIVPVEDYDDEDWEDYSRRQSDIQFTAPLLRAGDVAEFTLSYSDWGGRWLALRAGVLKGIAFRRDFQDLLVNYPRRLKYNLDARALRARLLYDHDWKWRDVRGLAVDWPQWRITYPPGSTDEQKREFNDVLMRGVAPQLGYLAGYRRKWFGKIMERYRQSRTRVIFIRLPRGPVIRPENLVVKKSSSVREFASRPGVLLADENLFEEIERPEWFGDPTHMNTKGSAQFSRILAEKIAGILDSKKESGR